MPNNKQTVDKAISKKELIDDNSHNSRSLDMASIVKIEPADVGKDGRSLDTAYTLESELESSNDVKQEMDIEPIVLQPLLVPDVTWRPCKPEPVEDSPAQNTDAAMPQGSRTTKDSTSTYTSQHVGTHSVELDDGPYCCGICKDIFKLKNELQNHVFTIHTDKTQHFCYICFKYFVNQSYLKNHVLIHTGERPHCCSVCNKRFTHKVGLKIHMITHTGERPHCCNLCNKTYSQKSKLKKHLLIHTTTTK